MNIMKKCFTVVVSMAMCTAVMVQPFGDNIRILKSEVVSYAVDTEISAAEHYADVVMNNYDTCSDLVDLSAELDFFSRSAVGSFSFMDIDFDGELEFIVHRREAGTRRGGSAEIFKIDRNNLKSIMRVNDTFIENFEGLYCDENGNKFFIGNKSAGGFGGIASGLYKMYIKDGQLVEEELFREIDWNAPASGDLYGTHEYHQNGEKIDVTEDEYNARIEEYKSSLTNLNLSYQQFSSFNSFEKMSDEEKREFFISSYNAFNYDGFQRQDDIPVEIITQPAENIIAEGTSGENINWKIDGNGTLFINGSGDVEGVIEAGGDGIPAWYPYVKVPAWTLYNDKIYNVVIEEGITNIQMGSFLNSKLKEINIPESVTNIGTHAFDNCDNLISVVIPDNVERISNSAFLNCDNLVDVKIGKKLRSIDSDAFNGCLSLKTITIPENVKYIGEYAFDNCTNLESVTIENPNCEFSSVFYDDKYIIPHTATIYGYSDSTAQEYAEKYNIKFVALDSARPDETSENISGRYSKENLYIDVTGELNSDGTIRIEYVNDRFIRSIALYKGIIKKDMSFQENDGYGLNSYKISFNDGTIDISIHGIECTNKLEGWLIPDINETISKTSDTIPDYDISSWSADMIILAINNYLQKSDVWNQYTVSLSDIDGHRVLLRDSDKEPTKYWVGWNGELEEDLAVIAKKDSGVFLDIFHLTEYYSDENQDKTYGDYTYRINENDEIVIVKYNGSDENVEIPSEIDGKKVTVISGVEGPADLEYPRIGAFEGNSAIKSVVIPDTVTTIEMNSFKACDNLQNVTMSENIQTIEQYAFSDCNLSYIYLSESISDIGDCALGYSGGSVIDDFVIYGFTGTVAETYANNNEILFVVRNNDETIIQPLDISLDYERVSTLSNDDTVQLINFPVYKIKAKIKNIDIKTADNVSVELVPSKEMSLIGCEKIQTTEIIGSNEEVTFTWTVKIDSSKSYSTECKVYAKADNSVKSESYLTIAFDNTVTEKDNRFDFTKDTWKFTNSNIKPTYYFSKGYYIQEKYLTKLYQRLPNTAIEKVKELLNSEWVGSCYGISVVAILDKLDILDVTDYDENATCVHDAKSPAESDEISSLINAYQVSWNLPPVQNVVDEFNKLNTHEKLVKLIDSVEDVKSGGCPVAFYLYWYKQDVSIKDKEEEYNAAAHEVVAYDIERLEKPYKIKNVVTGAKEDYSIRISLYDCSASGDKPIYMYITDDYNHWSIPELCGGYACQDYREEISRPLEGGRYDTLYYKNEADFNIITDPSVLDCFSWTDFTSNYKAVLSVNNKTNLLIKWNNSTYKFMIDKLVDGAYNAGEEITTFFSNAGAENLNGVSQANINYVLPSLDGEYIISDPDGNATDIDYTLTYGNSMISAEASGAKSVTFNTDSVSIEADNSDYELAMTFNEGYYSMPWYTITASGNEANIVSMEQTDNGVILNSDNMESVKISANNTDEIVELTFTADTDNVLISNNDENNLEIYEDTDNNGSYETLISTTASDDETDTNQDNNTNNSSKSQTSNNNSKADNNTKSFSTASSPQTGDNITNGIPALIMAAVAMIIFRKRK